MMRGFRDHAKKHGKLTPQMEKDMSEIDAMMENMNAFGDRVNQNLDNIGKRAGVGQKRR